MKPDARVLVVGGGVTGLTVANELLGRGVGAVTVIEADDAVGGKIRTSAFAGLPAVDEGPDAFLTRVPDAVDLVEDLGLTDTLVHPSEATAAVWYPGGRGGPLHPIPGGTMLGVPAEIMPFVRTGLLSLRGKARAALEPVLPRTAVDHDELGTYVRRRVGAEVHERLVDALVGSIYAADTDRTSLRSVPQLAGLADAERSLVIGARRARRRMLAASGGRDAAAAPIFAAPAAGMSDLIGALHRRVLDRGGVVHIGTTATGVTRDGTSWRVGTDTAVVDSAPWDHVVFATPARTTASVLADAAPVTAASLATMDHADVIMVTLAVPGADWPDHLRGRSGYLVPKPVQRHVTAVSFASQKWAHWHTEDRSQILRASIGRDGAPVDHLDDEAAVRAVVDEISGHLGFDVAPTEVRTTRWTNAFPHYRPHHEDWVRHLSTALPDGLHVVGASYHGIGIPACIRGARTLAERIAPDSVTTTP